MDGAIGVSTFEESGAVILDSNTGGVHWGDNEVIPVYALGTFKNNSVEVVLGVGHVVDIDVEKQADHTGGSVLVSPRGLGGAVSGAGRRYATLASETDTTPEPW